MPGQYMHLSDSTVKELELELKLGHVPEMDGSNDEHHIIIDMGIAPGGTLVIWSFCSLDARPSCQERWFTEASFWESAGVYRQSQQCLQLCSIHFEPKPPN
jgi:hypothetical protein